MRFGSFSPARPRYTEEEWAQLRLRAIAWLRARLSNTRQPDFFLGAIRFIEENERIPAWVLKEMDPLGTEKCVGELNGTPCPRTTIYRLRRKGACSLPEHKAILMRERTAYCRERDRLDTAFAETMAQSRRELKRTLGRGVGPKTREYRRRRS